MPHLILLSALSGAGKSSVLKILEDLGYLCVDNLPLNLMLETTALHDKKDGRLVISLDKTHLTSIDELHHNLALIRQNNWQINLLHLEANIGTLVSRYSETRRPHPLALDGQSIVDCIRQDMDSLADLAEKSVRLDTSDMSINMLHHWLKTWIQTEVGLPTHANFCVIFTSFGFKNSIPIDIDFLFDVRSLPNPYYDLDLRHLTGQDQDVINFFTKHPIVGQMADDIRIYLEKYIPIFQETGRYAINVGIGCTGGIHRSVFIVEMLANYFHHTWPDVLILVRHKSLDLFNKLTDK